MGWLPNRNCEFSVCSYYERLIDASRKLFLLKGTWIYNVPKKVAFLCGQ